MGLRSLALVVAQLLLWAQSPVVADTGFLDRSIVLGKITHRYQVYVPAEYSRTRRWPIWVDLHSNGVQGRDGMQQTVVGLADQIRQDRMRFPVIVLFPQAEPEKRWFDADMEELVIAELDHTMAEFHGDPARVYLSGFSMGATGAYRIAYRWPERFAALVAIAGRVDSSDAAAYSDADKEADRRANAFLGTPDPFAALAARLKHLRIRIFHGDADDTVPIEQSRRLVSALKAVGTQVEYDEYPGASHVGTAQKATADADMIRWMLAQHRY